MSDRIDLATNEPWTTRLTLAVELVDTYTKGRPRNDLRVSAADIDTSPVTNPSGFHLFLDLPDEQLTVVVDGGDRYLNREKTIDPTALDPPIVRLEMTPSPGYRFPPGATLLRGSVVDETDDPIAAATVSIHGTDRETMTNEHGEFVLFLTNLSSDDVQQTGDGTRQLRIDGDVPEVHVTHPTYEPTTAHHPMEEGSTTLIGPVKLVQS